MGYVTHNVPVTHPDFGKAFPCECQHAEIDKRRANRLFELSNLAAVVDKTFESFERTRADLNATQQSILQDSFSNAALYAEKPDGWIVFEGSYGSGKTHLAAAIGNYRLAQGDSVLFLTTPDLLDHLRGTFGPSSETQYDELFERVKNAPLLILDDLGAESATPWAQEKLYQLINHRYMLRLPTVVTTNIELDKLDQRIRSRLVDWDLSNTVSMHLPDFRRSDAALERNIFSDPRLYSHMTFEAFDFREKSLPEQEQRNLRQAYEIAYDYAQNPQQWLLFVGTHGCGKTHLAAAIANYRLAQQADVILVTAPDLLDYLRAAFNPASGVTFAQRFYDIRSAPLLIIDNLDLSNASSWAREKIRQIVDHRYLAHLPTVFTTAQEFKDLDPMVRSRLLDARHCRTFAILAPDYRGGYVPRR